MRTVLISMQAYPNPREGLAAEKIAMEVTKCCFYIWSLRERLIRPLLLYRKSIMHIHEPKNTEGVTEESLQIPLRWAFLLNLPACVQAAATVSCSRFGCMAWCQKTNVDVFTQAVLSSESKMVLPVAIFLHESILIYIYTVYIYRYAIPFIF